MLQPLDPQIYGLFQRVDVDGAGYASKNELQQALSSCCATSLETVEIMIDMFDKNNCRQIDPYGFQDLWGYLGRWLQSFQAYDRDGSGRLEHADLAGALQHMGYQLPRQFFPFALKKFDLQKRGSLDLDGFIRLGIFLQSTGQLFRKFDPMGRGCAQIAFENLLEIVLFSTGPVPPSQMMQPMMMMQPQQQQVINITIVNN